MRVLLIGEFSSLHKFLKEGLLELGNIDVFLAANGDGWKKIGGNDSLLYNNRYAYEYKNFKRLYTMLVEPYKIAKQFVDYDVVQFINTSVYSISINENLVSKIAKKNKCVSLVAAGDDYKLYQAYKNNRFDYAPFDYDQSCLNRFNHKTFKGKLNIHNDKKIEKISDVIIPCMYEYSIGYSSEKKYSIIPLPINVRNIEYHENIVKNKMVFFHGVIREKAKGTPFIRTALERLEKNYSNDVEVVIDGHLPYQEYVDVMKRANVVIDQCCCYSYGINACIAMAQGKVVMAGNRKETREGLGVSYSPIIHIEPDVDQIYKQLVYLVEHKEHMAQMGYDSRKYVEDVHDNIKIARNYVEAWKSTGKL